MPGRVNEGRPVLRAMMNNVSGLTAVRGIVRTAPAVVDVAGFTFWKASAARVVKAIWSAPRPAWKSARAARVWPGTTLVSARGAVPANVAVVKVTSLPAGSTGAPPASCQGFPAASVRPGLRRRLCSAPGGSPLAARNVKTVLALFGITAKTPGNSRFTGVNVSGFIGSSNVRTASIQSDWVVAPLAGATLANCGARRSGKAKLRTVVVLRPAASVARAVAVKVPPVCGAAAILKLTVLRRATFGVPSTITVPTAVTPPARVTCSVTSPLLSVVSITSSKGWAGSATALAAGVTKASEGAVPSATSTSKRCSPVLSPELSVADASNVILLPGTAAGGIGADKVIGAPVAFVCRAAVHAPVPAARKAVTAPSSVTETRTCAADPLNTVLPVAGINFSKAITGG